MNILIFEAPDGAITPVAILAAIEAGETEQEFHAYVAGRTRRATHLAGKGCVFRGVVPEEKLPPVRFRGFTTVDQKTGQISTHSPSAWRWNPTAGGLTIDLDAARTQILAETRHARNAALRESDRTKAMVDEIGTAEEKAALADYRQSLRDLPAVVAAEMAAMTLTELTDYKPSLPKVK
jgi:hypothetical protein